MAVFPEIRIIASPECKFMVVLSLQRWLVLRETELCISTKCPGDSTSAWGIFKKLLNYGIGHMDDNVKIDYFAVPLPNLPIFDDDLKARNLVHCHFLQGLGYPGLHDFEHSQKAFTEVLKLDAGHFGARIHQNMINQITEVAG